MFNGSHLGKHSFSSVIKWCSPYDSNSERLIPTLRAVLYWEGRYHCVLLKKNTTKLRTQCFMDEIKPLFGLRKIGTNTIELDGIIRKKNKDLPWICSNNKLQFDSLGFPILPSNTSSLNDYFIYDSNVYIHKQKTNYYIFSVATYEVKLMYANEINSYESANTSLLSEASNSSLDKDENENNSISSASENICNFYPNLQVKKCCWYSGAPGVWNKGRSKKKIIEEPNNDQKLLYYEIQKIIIFRQLLEVNLMYNKDIIFSPKKEFEDELMTKIPISINEFRFRNTGSRVRKNLTAEEKFYFPTSTSHYEILNSMIINAVANFEECANMEEEYFSDYRMVLDIFRIKLYNLIKESFPDEIYHFNKIMDKLTNNLTLYNEVILKN